MATADSQHPNKNSIIQKNSIQDNSSRDNDSAKQDQKIDTLLYRQADRKSGDSDLKERKSDRSRNRSKDKKVSIT